MTTNTNSAQERTASIDLDAEREAMFAADPEGMEKVKNAGLVHAAMKGWLAARRSLTSGAPTEPVAYLHQVVSGDGEPDQALSFAPDNFPLAGTLGYRSISHVPLNFGCSTESAAIAKKAFDAAILLASDTINAKNAEIEDLRAQLSAGAAAKTEQVPCSHVWNDFGQLGGRNVSWCARCDTLTWTGKEPEASAAGAGSAQPRDVCAEMRALCSSCGGTGDVHSIVGEWRGECNCPAGIALALDRLKIAAAKTQRENEELRAALTRVPSRDAGQEEASTQTVQEAFAWAAFADNGNVIIWSRCRTEVEPVAAKYGKPLVPVIAYIDGRTAGTGKEQANADQA